MYSVNSNVLRIPVTAFALIWYQHMDLLLKSLLLAPVWNQLSL
jgi:hypothetical protein